MRAKKWGAVLASAAAVVGMTVVAAPAADAATSSYGCVGSRIDAYPVKAADDGNKVYGTVYLYYNAAKQKNCVAEVSSAAEGYGTKKPMSLMFSECAETTPGTRCHQVGVNTIGDNGNYKYYAGPLTVHAPHHCVMINASITWKGHQARVDTLPVHCG